MIWRRESTTGFPYYEYSISRSWKGEAGKTGYSQNYFSRYEAQLINVIGQATQWIAEAEAKNQAGDESPAGETPTASGNAQLEDAELQEKYRKEYLAQLRRLSCPGCGEDYSAF